MGRFVFWGILLIVSSTALAKDAQVEAVVDRTSLAVGDVLTLSITIYGGGNVGEPNVSQIDGFDIVSVSTSHSVSIVNMRVSKSMTYEYRLMAVSEGQYTLGPFEVKVDDALLQTEPIKVVVTKGRPAQRRHVRQPHEREVTAQSDDVLLIASVDRKRAYVGQQVTYTLKFAYRVNLLGDTEYIPPEHSGFWSEDMGQTGPTVETINGGRYYVIRRRIALFPISSGKLTIGEAAVRYVAEEPLFSEDPFAIFKRNPFQMFGGTEGIARSKPIEVDVLPLPGGAPANFSGAVGRFNVSVEPSSHQVKVGESLTLSLKVDGEGNLNSVGDIPLPEPVGFKVFAPKAKESKRVEGTKIYGTKIYDLVLVPQHAGNYQIGSFSFCYFDPYKEQYVTAKAGPVEISVLPGGEVTQEAPAGAGIVVSHRDIRHIRKSLEDWDDVRLNLSRGREILVRVAPIAIALIGLLMNAIHRRSVRTGRAIAGRALKNSLKELKRASEILRREGKSAEAAAIASQAIRSYIATRMGRGVASIQISTLENLDKLKVDTRKELVHLINSLDEVRFAPVGLEKDRTSELLERTAILLKKVDREW